MPDRHHFAIAAAIAVIGYCNLGLAQSAALPAPSTPQVFVHPGILHNRADLEFIKAKVQAGEEPWKSAWLALRNSPHAQLSWKPKPRADLFRGSHNNPDIGAGDFKSDGVAAYTHAIQWAITGDKAYAEKAIEILNAYPPVFKTFEGGDARLAIGETAVHFLNAAEIIRYSEAGWQPADIEQFKLFMRDKLYPIIKPWVPTYNGNWDAAMIQSKLAMGIFLDDRAIFDEGVNHFTSGRSNGAIVHYIDAIGECQESGRDQAHAQMGLGFLACACEIAWKQGIDLYAVGDNRLLKGFEYTAKYNLGNDVPYEPYRSIGGHYNYETIAEKGRGRFSPIYEKVYHHYHDRRGLDMPLTRQVVEKIRPETEIGSNTHVPWGTLMFAGLPAK
jgi:Alginate lyase